MLIGITQRLRNAHRQTIIQVCNMDNDEDYQNVVGGDNDVNDQCRDRGDYIDNNNVADDDDHDEDY